ncbi:MAG: phage tail sheath family protein [Rhodocyclaceae bacterium]|nr:phage tail sheath family protein [Rhodocyclaceae bacterium]MBX3667528.1 phage tail sheath family protein [Rhodocyclaceae bacterium]
MPTYNVPGVWVEELSLLPPSVAQVATAVPAFIGYTEKGSGVARITSLLEYESQFGKANPSAYSVTVAGDGSVSLTRSDASTNRFLMYYALTLFFRNGGGPCYIVSTGNYSATPAKAAFVTGLGQLEQLDEPTLIVLVDAINLSKTDYYDLAQQALAQCGKLADRFAILDVPREDNKSLRDDATSFRNGVGTNYLSYGAAYHPFLLTSLNYQYLESGVKVPGPLQWSSGTNGFLVSRTGSGPARVKVAANADATVTTFDFDTTTESGTLSIVFPANGLSKDAVTAWNASSKAKSGFSVVQVGDGSAGVKAASADLAVAQLPLSSLKTTNTGLYNKVKTALANDPASQVVLPPSSAIAGIYARVDAERGVWKAPANVSVSSVIGPVSNVSNDDQASLNVDPDSGKSINAIRSFTGKGTLVWGSRTLLGNDNEWRYVPVRRLFIMIEESTRKASAFAVFEPNDANTWLKVKAMIGSYLFGLWEQGALAGSKPEQAYFVNVGLGKTMTAQDILEGRMIVEIGIAAVRPAEFIILRFSHKMQEA